VVPVVADGVAPVVAGGVAPVVAGGVAPVVAGGVAPVVARIAELPAPAPAAFDEPEVGVVVVAGSVVSGVGSGGNGLDNTLAIMESSPASDWWRYLYQVARLSIHSFF
jgi:hypothetical protein